MKIHRKTQMRLGNGAVADRKVAVLMVQLDKKEQDTYAHLDAMGYVPLRLGPLTMAKFFDVDGTLYLGAEDSQICQIRRTWLHVHVVGVE